MAEDAAYDVHDVDAAYGGATREADTRTPYAAADEAERRERDEGAEAVPGTREAAAAARDAARADPPGI